MGGKSFARQQNPHRHRGSRIGQGIVEKVIIRRAGVMLLVTSLRSVMILSQAESDPALVLRQLVG